MAGVSSLLLWLFTVCHGKNVKAEDLCFKKSYKASGRDTSTFLSLCMWLGSVSGCLRELFLLGEKAAIRGFMQGCAGVVLLLSLFRQGGYFDLNEGYLSEGVRVLSGLKKGDAVNRSVCELYGHARSRCVKESAACRYKLWISSLDFLQNSFMLISKQTVRELGFSWLLGLCSHDTIEPRWLTFPFLLYSKLAPKAWCANKVWRGIDASHLHGSLMLPLQWCGFTMPSAEVNQYKQMHHVL